VRWEVFSSASAIGVTLRWLTGICLVMDFRLTLQRNSEHPPDGPSWDGPGRERVECNDLRYRVCSVLVLHT